MESFLLSPVKPVNLNWPVDERDYNQIVISYLVWLKLALFQNLKAHCIGIA